LGGPREVIVGRQLSAHQQLVELPHQLQALHLLGQQMLGQCPKAQLRMVSLPHGPALLV